MASTTFRLAPKGFSFEASFITFFNPNSRSSSLIGLPPWYGFKPRIDSHAFIKLRQDKIQEYLVLKLASQFQR